MALYDYDLIVIGSGAGGSITAQQVAKSGKSVAIIEAGTFGGQSANFTSVPAKALLQAAQVYKTAKNGTKFGVRGSTIGYNYPTAKAWKDHVVKQTGVTSGEEYFLNQGINVVHGRAYFIDPHTISVGSARFTAREFLIATGSEMTLPEIPGLSTGGFMTNREAMNLLRPPKSLAVIGAGVSGCELAQLFAIFGTKVTIIESAPRVLSDEEPEVATSIQNTFSTEYGMNVLLEATVEKVEKIGLSRKLTVKSASKKREVNVDEILVTTGSKALVDIGLENAGVSYDNGTILTNAYMQTSASHIYAVGDCTTPAGYTHLSAYQGQVAAHNLMHSKRPISADYHAVPRVIFTDPEIAAVGPTENELKEKGLSFKSAIAPISVITRSNITGRTEGFVKVIASSKTNTLLGATIVSPHAGEMIHELALAVQNYLTATQVARTIHAFPTWSESVRVACTKLAKLK